MVNGKRNFKAISGTHYILSEAMSALCVAKAGEANESAEPRMQEIGWFGGTISILPDQSHKCGRNTESSARVCPMHTTALPITCMCTVDSVLAILSHRHGQHCMRITAILSLSLSLEGPSRQCNPFHHFDGTDSAVLGWSLTACRVPAE